jgi:hypothetical protein
VDIKGAAIDKNKTNMRNQFNRKTATVTYSSSQIYNCCNFLAREMNKTRNAFICCLHMGLAGKLQPYIK